MTRVQSYFFQLTHHLLKKAGHTVSFSREVMQIESLLSDFGSDLALRKEKGARVTEPVSRHQ